MGLRTSCRPLRALTLASMCMGCGVAAARADPVTFPLLGFNPGILVSGTVELSATAGDTILSGAVQVVSGGILPPGADLTNPADVARSNQFSVLGGEFRFTSGSFIDSEEFPDPRFGPGTLELTGAIPALGIAESSTLFTGMLAGVTYAPREGFALINLSGRLNSVHPLLVALYDGLPPDPSFGFGGTIRTNEGPTSVEQSHTLLVSSSQATLFVRPAAVQPVPEPATLFLVGSGCLAVRAAMRRRRAVRE